MPCCSNIICRKINAIYVVLATFWPETKSERPKMLILIIKYYNISLMVIQQASNGGSHLLIKGGVAFVLLYAALCSPIKLSSSCQRSIVKASWVVL